MIREKTFTFKTANHCRVCNENLVGNRKINPAAYWTTHCGQDQLLYRVIDEINRWDDGRDAQGRFHHKPQWLGGERVDVTIVPDEFAPLKGEKI